MLMTGVSMKKIPHNCYANWIGNCFKIKRLNYLCIGCPIFPVFSAKKLGVHIRHKNYIINFSFSHTPPHNWHRMTINYMYSPNYFVLWHYREISTGICVCL